jgi:hypothetical protein
LLLASTAGIQTAANESDEDIRYGIMSSALETYIRASALLHFFETGRLIRMADLPFTKNEEYLAGVIGFSQELQVKGSFPPSCPICLFFNFFLQPLSAHGPSVLIPAVCRKAGQRQR